VKLQGSKRQGKGRYFSLAFIAMFSLVGRGAIPTTNARIPFKGYDFLHVIKPLCFSARQNSSKEERLLLMCTPSKGV
jgi:hypothetical protein